MSLQIKKRFWKKLNFWSTGVSLFVIQFTMFCLMTGIVTGIPKVINITNPVLNFIFGSIIFAGCLGSLIWVVNQIVEKK